MVKKIIKKLREKYELPPKLSRLTELPPLDLICGGFVLRGIRVAVQLLFYFFNGGTYVSYPLFLSSSYLSFSVFVGQRAVETLLF